MTARNDPSALTALTIAAVSAQANGDGIHDFASVVDGRNHHSLSVQIDSNVPHE